MKAEDFFQYKDVIFDFDGTIIDSADAIMKSLKYSLTQYSIQPRVGLTNDLIGPPLDELITTLTGFLINDPHHAELCEIFKKHYDDLGVNDTKLFPGMFDLLNLLKLKNINIWIATNKRRIPTFKILNLLNLQEIVNGVYTIDSICPNLASKSEILNLLVKSEILNIKSTIFIGDRESDRIAAQVNNIKFIMVPWGYENE